MTRRFQFSLRALLVTTAAIAIVLAAFMSKTEWVASISIRCILVIELGVAATMIPAGGKYVRAFGIGAALPLAVGAMWALDPIRDAPLYISGIVDIQTEATALLTKGEMLDFKFRAGFLMATALLDGCASAFARWLMQEESK